MRVGITGWRGFIGAGMVARLSAAGDAVVPLGQAGERLSLADAAPAGSLDWVLHFAARTTVAQSFGRTHAFFADNCAATLFSLEIARRAGAAFLYQSSYVYGVPERLPVDETHPVRPVNPYMASKLAGEELAARFCHLEGMRLVVLRAFNVYGPGLPPGRLVSDLVGAARRGEELVLNDPEPRRDYLHLDDYARLLRLLMAAGAEGVYNAGGGEPVSNLELAGLVRRLCGEARPVRALGQRRERDILACWADTGKAAGAVGWRPSRGLEDGLLEMLRAP